MNTFLANISDFLGSVAFIMGALTVYACWRRKNPVLFIFAFMLSCYQARNLIGSLSVLATGSALVRPSKLLVSTMAGRLIEITGSTVGWLYFSNKLQFQRFIGVFLSSDEMARTAPTAGDLPPEYWVGAFTKVVRDNIKDDYLKPYAE